MHYACLRLTDKRAFGTLLCGVVLCSCFSAFAQRRDPSALLFLSQAVQQAGSNTAFSVIQDFTASGAITHNWSTPEQGQLTIKARGLSQFRLDSEVAEGTWSFMVNNGMGQVVLPDGTTAPIAYHNVLNLGSLTLPSLKIYAALQDQTTTIIDVGLVSFGSGQARQIRTSQNFSWDSTGVFAKLTRRDYFFDPSSLVLLRTSDLQHPNSDAINGPLLHTIDYGNYQAVNGLVLPFSITETLAGNQIWRIQLSSIVFNTGLSDSDFQF